MLPSHLKAMPEKSEVAVGISIPYIGQESQKMIDFESLMVG
jgi:hypothetical protein